MESEADTECDSKFLKSLNDYMVPNMSDTNCTSIEEADAFKEFTKGLYTFGIPIVCIFGILGNIFSFRVFVFTSFSKQNSSIYIAALSLSDTGFLASLLLSWLSGGRIGVVFSHSPIWCHVLIYVTYVCSFLSVWYVVLIMIDRYIVVCHSLHVSELCTKKRARIATGIVTSFGLLLYCHLFFTADMEANCALQFKPFMLKIISIFIYTDTAITFIIPFAIIFVLNIVVIISMKRFQQQQGYLRDRFQTTEINNWNVLSKAQYRITRTFILVSVVLLLTNVPSHGIRFYIIVNHLVQSRDTLLYHAQHVFQIIYYINFATNFLLYSVSSKRFRKYLRLKYLCYCCERREQRYRTNEELYRKFHVVPARQSLQRRLIMQNTSGMYAV